MRALLLVFVFAASALASDSVRELAADEYGPRLQAKEAGVFLGGGLPAAQAGEEESVLFVVEAQPANAGVEGGQDRHDAALHLAGDFFFHYMEQRRLAV